MSPLSASCDPADVLHFEREVGKNPNILGVGVIDSATGQIRLFTYDETDAFSLANRHLQVMAGHEAAAVMAGMPIHRVRGFAFGKRGYDWHVFNASHLNQPDGQANTMQMAPATLNAIIAALRAAGAPRLIVH